MTSKQVDDYFATTPRSQDRQKPRLRNLNKIRGHCINSPSPLHLDRTLSVSFPSTLGSPWGRNVCGELRLKSARLAREFDTFSANQQDSKLTMALKL